MGSVLRDDTRQSRFDILIFPCMTLVFHRFFLFGCIRFRRAIRIDYPTISSKPFSLILSARNYPHSQDLSSHLISSFASMYYLTFYLPSTCRLLVIYLQPDRISLSIHFNPPNAYAAGL